MTSALEKEARRTAFILAAAQSVVGAAAPVSISMGALTGSYLLAADKSLATAPVTGYNLGVALGALPAAWLMHRVGRRHGFMSGAALTALGGALATAAIFKASFWFFAAALILVGTGGSFVQQYRFAAADNAPHSFKPKAISWVLGGGVFAAIIGPQTVIFTRNLFDPVMFAGAYASLIVLGALGIVILSFLHLKKDVAPEAAMPVDDAPARPLSVIMRQPKFVVALICAIGSYALMSFVMTGAPLAMVGCGFTPDEATLGISWHVMAMFAPSFFTGKLIARFGKETIVATGLALLIGCGVIALSGIALWQFWLALILLGVGWNFGFIGATAMVAETYHAAEKNAVQGAHDFMLFGTVAFASLMSGQVYNSGGWDMLNWTIFPVAALCLGALALLLVIRQRQAGPA
ncbi:MAG: MFS transporter [Notoacmeibacter sp.]|nr:MFS transporter [Notoacmeibacter sp.]